MTLAFLIVAAGSGCQDRTVRVQGTPTTNTTSGLSSSTAFQVGVKTAEQLSATMSSLTGVPRTRNNVRDAFNNLRTQLPSSHDLASFQASHQIAIAKLATEYCDGLFETADLRTALLPGVNFNQNPNQAYANAAVRSTAVDRLIEKFWGTGLEKLPSPEAAREELVALFGDLVTGASNNTTGTRNIAKGVCTAVLAASPVTLL